MTEKLIEQFTSFLHLAQESLRTEPHSHQRGNLRLLHSSSASLKDHVETLEASRQFQMLCGTIEAQIGDSGFGSHGWKHAVGNWFRRSGLYHRVAAGETLPDAQSLLERLQAALARRESTVT